MADDAVTFRAEGNFLLMELVGASKVSESIQRQFREPIELDGVLLAFYIANIRDTTWEFYGDIFMEIVDESGFTHEPDGGILSDLNIPGAWNTVLTDVQPGRIYKYLTYVPNVTDINRIHYERAALNALAGVGDSGIQHGTEEELDLDLKNKLIKDIEGAGSDVLKSVKSSGEAPTNPHNKDISKYQESENGDLPLNLFDSDGLFSEIQQFQSRAKPRGADYAVYVVECEKPPREQLLDKINELYTPEDTEELKNERGEANQQHPDLVNEIDTPETAEDYEDYNRAKQLRWTAYVIEADTIYYVGYTSHLPKRISDHHNGNGALFTQICPPVTLERVFWFKDQSEAIDAEAEIAMGLRTLTNGHRENPLSTNGPPLYPWDGSSKRVFAKWS